MNIWENTEIKNESQEKNEMKALHNPSIRHTGPACAGSYSSPKPGECRGYPGSY
jgi:hypothetical protein